MLKKILFFTLITVMILSSTIIFAAEADVNKEVLSLSLEEAIEYALKNSMDVKIKELELNKAEIVYDQNRKVLKQSEKALEFNVIPRTYEVTADDNVNMAMIKNGATERSIELARNISLWNMDLQKNQIRYQVEKAYYDLLQIEEELKIAMENFNLIKRQYETGKLNYDLGRISKQQFLGLELNLFEAQGVYDTVKMSRDLQLMNFKRIIGLPLDKEMELKDTIEFKEYEIKSLEEAISQAFENNIGLKIVKEKYEIEKLILSATKARYPEITYRYRQKEVEVHQALKNLESTKTAIELNVRKSYLNLITATKQIETYKLAVKQAENNLKIVQKSFELGNTTVAELMQANINLMNAKKLLSQQMYLYNLSILDYEYSMGIGMGTI